MESFGGQFREIVLGGAGLSYDVEKFFKRIKFPFTIGYGMTECGPLIAYDGWKTSRIASSGKILEGTIANVAPEGGRKHPDQKYIKVDTSNILFICGGAFSGLEKVIENRTEASGIGFGAMVKSKLQRSLTDVFREVEPEDLIKFGLIPELVGRMPVVATLAELTEEALVQILTEPKNAVVKQFSKLLAMEGVDLEIRPSALKAIARKALARKTGARGLRSILEQSLIDTMYELPSVSNVAKVVVDESTIEENQPPLLVYHEAAKKA